MPGSLTTPGRNRPRGFATVRIAFRPWNAVGARDESFAAQWLAYASPCRRFAADLAVDSARLGAGAVRETFTVEDSHLMLLAGLPAHSKLNPCFSFVESSHFNDLRGPPPHFSFEADSGCKCGGKIGVFPRVHRRSFGPRFRSSGCLSKGRAGAFL